MAEFRRKTRGIVVLHRCLLNSAGDIPLKGSLEDQVESADSGISSDLTIYFTFRPTTH